MTLTDHIAKEPGIGMTVAFSPDGKKIVNSSGSKTDGSVKVWNAATGRSESLKEEANSHLITSTVPTGPFGMKTSNFEYSVTAPVAFSPDGKSIASCTSIVGEKNFPQGRIRILDLATEQATRTILVQDPKLPTWFMLGVAFSPDGKKIVGGGGSFPIPGFNPIIGNQPPVAWLKVWDVASGKETMNLKVQNPRARRHCVQGVAFSPDGTKIANGGVKTVDVWDAESGRRISKLKGHTERVATVAFSPDSRKIASGGEDMTVRVWDVPIKARSLWLSSRRGMPARSRVR